MRRQHSIKISKDDIHIHIFIFFQRTCHIFRLSHSVTQSLGRPPLLHHHHPLLCHPSCCSPPYCCPWLLHMSSPARSRPGPSPPHIPWPSPSYKRTYFYCKACKSNLFMYIFRTECSMRVFAYFIFIIC